MGTHPLRSNKRQYRILQGIVVESLYAAAMALLALGLASLILR